MPRSHPKVCPSTGTRSCRQPPKADGGDNYITNRAMLCGPCNTRKGSKRTISGMRADNKDWITDQAAAERALAAAQAAGQEALREAYVNERQ